MLQQAQYRTCSTWSQQRSQWTCQHCTEISGSTNGCWNQ